MAKYQAYAEYKDSGAEWLGSIPKHWSVEYSKWLFEERNNKANVGDEMLTASQKYGVIPQKMFMELEQQKVVQVQLGHEILKRAEVNDFVISMRSFQGGIEYCGYKGAVSSAYVPLKPRQDLSLSYYRYLFKSIPYIQALQTTTNLVRDGQALRFANFIQVRIPLLPYFEAEKIGQFLDHETAKIDHLIEKQQQLIELLKEKRQAVISHAVTKGLDPSVPMKDSGVEWLGKVPEHWKIMKLGIAVFMQEGPGLRTWQFTDSGTRVICVTNITEDGINFSKLEKFISTSEYIQSYQHFTVNKGDVLLSSSGNSWGKIATYDDDELVILNTSTIRLNELPSKIIDQNYIRHILSSISTREQLGLMMTGSCQPNFGPSHLKEVKVMVPPIHEQTKIINTIQEIIVKFDNLINKADKQISLMQERRTALISAAVTGKIDVRNWQAPTSAEAHTELSA